MTPPTLEQILRDEIAKLSAQLAKPKRLATTPRAKSENQAVGTPKNFLTAVRAEFGPIYMDLAAVRENAVCQLYNSPSEDSLDPKTIWPLVKDWLWLNPPFANIDPWAARCAREVKQGRNILFLVPASVDSNWFAKHVQGIAKIYWCSPRLVFVGHDKPYPKPMMLAVYSQTWARQHWLNPIQWRWRP